MAPSAPLKTKLFHSPTLKTSTSSASLKKTHDMAYKATIYRGKTLPNIKSGITNFSSRDLREVPKLYVQKNFFTTGNILRIKDIKLPNLNSDFQDGKAVNDGKERGSGSGNDDRFLHYDSTSWMNASSTSLFTNGVEDEVAHSQKCKLDRILSGVEGKDLDNNDKSSEKKDNDDKNHNFSIGDPKLNDHTNKHTKRKDTIDSNPPFDSSLRNDKPYPTPMTAIPPTTITTPPRPISHHQTRPQTEDEEDDKKCLTTLAINKALSIDEGFISDPLDTLIDDFVPDKECDEKERDEKERDEKGNDEKERDRKGYDKSDNSVVEERRGGIMGCGPWWVW